jgi:chromosome segregation ATPase
MGRDFKMNNIMCEELEEIELSTKGGQLTLMELYTRLNKLELENGILKANNYELKKQNLQLRSDINGLHNRLNENREYTTLVDGNDDDLSYMDEYAQGNEELEEELSKAYKSTSDDYKFGGHDIKEL